MTDEERAALIKETQIQFLIEYAKGIDQWVDSVLGTRETIHWFNRESEMRGDPIIEDDVHIDDYRAAAEVEWENLHAKGLL